MTLQERILEVLGEKALQPQALYNAMKGEQPSAVDMALSALMRSGAVTRELGHYQRGNVRPMPAKETVAGVAPIATSTTLRVAAAKVDAAVAACKATLVVPGATVSHAKREQEVWALHEQGLAHKEIAARLGITGKCVGAHLSNARKKLGIKPVGGGRPERRERSNGASVTSRAGEGAAPAAVEAAPRTEPLIVSVHVPASRKPTFSPALIARLVEMQRSKVMRVEMLREKLSMEQQDLADIEEIVRIATAKEPT